MARRRRGRPIDGVLLLDKGEGVTSNRALQQVRRLFQAQKAGHTGTLDPMATGLLPICLGEATKFSSWLLDADKRYLADVRLGAVTDTGDREGAILKECAVPSLSDGDIESALSGFLGEIDQVPPMYSALKHQGRPLYEHARAGREIARAPRRVSIYDIALTSRYAQGFSLDVSVSKGTYIRTLAEDLGEWLGCGAHLEGLRRLRTGPFDDSNMLDIEALESMSDEQRLERLLPVDALISHLPALSTDDDGARRILQGQPIALETLELTEGSVARLYHDQSLLGVVTISGSGQCSPRRLINTADERR
ncbi:tRNA pseudouridine(55) synthase TruB [Kushneria marisflavi]|uniref:tRNA pseudouridine synthase B n=1 Tax=Kushneria marisflavi TaxID=157779 RepID=A0A240URB0_9GAMM|nr:tRNA pseudouridine(55) synthase TruB [Kushneria marisflavi]ART63560.1 tRNA pseudouridine(55) synthase TruB [Kushneria marisflavi]RKD75809.1 tRNA pseudouridine synthase B [Kushneria marisflavi]